MSLVRNRVRQVARASGFLGVTAGMLPVYLSHLKRAKPEERDLVRDLWVRRWARALLSLFAVETVIDGNVPPPTRSGDRGRLIVANHRSAIDIGVILATFGGKMVSRADVAGWPVVGAAARSVGTVFVDRSSARSGAATIRSIQKELEDGQSIGLFAEGTTFDGDVVRPFHGGAFIGAARANAEILPVGLAYPKNSGAAYLDETFLSHLGRMAKSDATRMVVAVGDPFACKGMKAGAITERAQKEVQALVHRARERCGP